MKVLEIRRHSWRKHGGGSQLSQRGVDLARSLGASMGPFDTVAASVVPRARETAIAMGFAVDVELVTLSADPALYREGSGHRWWEQPHPFAALAAIIREGPSHHRYANSMAALWRDLLTPLPEGGRVLVIGHSGEIEASLVACFPDADHSAWGVPFGPCEGARLAFAGDPEHFTDLEFVRLPEIAGDPGLMSETIAAAESRAGTPTA